MNWKVFTFGVVNALVTAWFIGAYPQHYWVYYVAQGIPMLVIRQRTWVKTKLWCYLLDFCWLTNYVLVTLGALCVLLQFGGFFPHEYLAHKGFLLFFAVATGPLLWAVAATGNSLVFHSFELTCSLFIHASPMLVAYTLRWHAAEVEEAYPGLLGGAAALQDIDLIWDLAIPGCAYYFVWWVPYTLWLLTDGISRPERGYDTVFANFQDLVKTQLGIANTRIAALVYMSLHAFATNLSWLTVVACYATIYFHTLLILVMLFLCIKSGAAMYEYLILDSYEATLRSALDARGEFKAPPLV